MLKYACISKSSPCHYQLCRNSIKAITLRGMVPFLLRVLITFVKPVFSYSLRTYTRALLHVYCACTMLSGWMFMALDTLLRKGLHKKMYLAFRSSRSYMYTFFIIALLFVVITLAKMSWTMQTFDIFLDVLFICLLFLLAWTYISSGCQEKRYIDTLRRIYEYILAVPNLSSFLQLSACSCENLYFESLSQTIVVRRRSCNYYVV